MLTLLLTLFVVSARPATLTWGEDEQGDVAGYKVYFFQGATAFPPINVGLTNSHTLTNLDLSLVYSIYVTAYNDLGMESVPSPIIRYPQDDYCVYALSLEDISLASEPYNGSFDVLTTGECYWSAVATEPWISITSLNERTGPATVSYNVRKNPDLNSRRGFIIAADQLFVITQSGADVAPVIVEPLPPTLDLSEETFVQVQVGATGTSLRYQWFKDGALIPDATNSVLKLQAVKLDDAGVYTVNVFNSAGLVTDGAMTITVLAKPTILADAQPHSILSEVGEPAFLSVGATGTGLHYFWMKDGLFPVGGDSPVLELPFVVAEDFGKYQVLIANAAGWTTSEIVSIALRDPDQPPATLSLATQDGELQLTVVGKPGAVYEVILSTDLEFWFSITTIRVETDGATTVFLPDADPFLFLHYLFVRTVRR